MTTQTDSNSGGKLLIVDDEPIIQHTLEALLLGEGYQLDYANDGNEGLKKVSSFQPDVILLDVMMPGMNGLEVCWRLKNDATTRHIPIIMVTALNSKDDLANSLNAGADEFLAKPVSGVELRARVKSMLRIKHQYDDLNVLLHLRDDLANMLVHDLRSPLTKIQAASEAILNNKALSPSDTQRVEQIFNQSQHLNSMLNDMLLLAKMENSELSLDHSLIDIIQLISSVAQNNQMLAEARSVKLDLQFNNGHSEIWGDLQLMTRVIDNLLSNAFNLSPVQGTVTVNVQFLEKENKQLMQIRFSDQGSGVPAESREVIFDKFKIVELKKSGIPQLGLGLAFCKMVIDAHNGNIWVEPNTPCGSTFVIELNC